MSWTRPSDFTSYSLTTSSGYASDTGQGGLASAVHGAAKSRIQLSDLNSNSGSQGVPQPSDPQTSFMLLLQGSSRSHFNLAKPWPHLWGHGPIQSEVTAPSSDLIAFWHASLLPYNLPIRFVFSPMDSFLVCTEYLHLPQCLLQFFTHSTCLTFLVD